MKGDQ